MNRCRLAAISCLSLALIAAAACSGDDDASTTTAPPVTTPAGPAPDSESAGSTNPVDDTLAPDDTFPPGDTTVDTVVTTIELDNPIDEEDPDDTEPPAQLALPADGPATIAGIELPSGTILTSDDQRLAWITDDKVPGAAQLWLQLYAAHPQTGLYPVLLYDDDEQPGWEADFFFPNQPFELDNYTIEEVLANSAEFNFDPPRQSNGPAPASSGPRDLDATEAAIAALPDARIALVETPRGADAISYMGWTGNATYDTAEAMATALRSWEQRYGARLVGVGPSSMRVAIERPPTAAEIDALSQELVLLDPDLESGTAPIEVVALGEGLLGQHLWTLWWLA